VTQADQTANSASGDPSRSPWAYPNTIRNTGSPAPDSGTPRANVSNAGKPGAPTATIGWNTVVRVQFKKRACAWPYAAPPTLISAPTSVLRDVTTPSNGVTAGIALHRLDARSNSGGMGHGPFVQCGDRTAALPDLTIQECICWPDSASSVHQVRTCSAIHSSIPRDITRFCTIRQRKRTIAARNLTIPIRIRTISVRN
jgi:hypothetical protein